MTIEISSSLIFSFLILYFLAPVTKTLQTSMLGLCPSLDILEYSYLASRFAGNISVDMTAMQRDHPTANMMTVT